MGGSGGVRKGGEGEAEVGSSSRKAFLAVLDLVIGLGGCSSGSRSAEDRLCEEGGREEQPPEEGCEARHCRKTWSSWAVQRLSGSESEGKVRRERRGLKSWDGKVGVQNRTGPDGPLGTRRALADLLPDGWDGGAAGEEWGADGPRGGFW